MEVRSGLPEGMVTTRDAATANIESVQDVNVDQIIKLWRASAASKAVLPDNTGARLENSFWRILRSERVMLRMNGQLLAQQIRSITCGDYIRTTPTGSPRSSRDMGTYYAISGRDRNPATGHPTTSMASSAGATLPSEPLRKDASYSEDDGTSTPTPTSPFGEASRRPPLDTVTENPPSSCRRKAHTDIADDAEHSTSVHPSPLGAVTTQGSLPGLTRRSETFRPPPILKKDSSGASSKSSATRSPRTSETSTIASSNESETNATSEDSPEIGSHRSTSSTGSTAPRRATRFSEEVAVSIPKVSISRSSGERSSRTQGDGSQRSNRRNPVVHASAGVGRKRPIVMRQRSSQISSAISYSKPSPTASGSSAEQMPGDLENLDETFSQDSAERLIQDLPGPSSAPTHRDHMALSSSIPEEAEPVPPVPNNPANPSSATLSTGAASTARLADRNKPQHRSFTNLPSAAWRSTAIAPAAASYQASGMLAGGLLLSSSAGKSNTTTNNNRQTFKTEIVPLKAPAPSTPAATGADAAAGDILPRTKSQLSLLLERSQAAAGQDVKGRSNLGKK